MYDVIIIGGGIIGSSVAWQLSRKKKKVLVIERKDVCSGSAGATDGVVGYHTKKPGLQLDLAVQSIEMFRTLNRDREIGGIGWFCSQKLSGRNEVRPPTPPK